MKHDPRSAKLKEKRSAPNLRTKRSAINIPASGKGRKVIKESYVPGVRSRASAPNLKQAAEELPPNPPSPPSEGPGSQTNKSNDKQDGVSQPKEIPRFMLLTETKIKPVEYRPPRQYTGPPIPKIMGIEPIFFRPKPVEIKKESRKERILKEIRKRYQVRKARVRGVVKNLRNIRALRTLHALKASVKAMRKDAQERILECKPIYHIKEIKELRRASMFLGLPRLQKRPLSTLPVGSTITLWDCRRYSEISVYSRAADSPKLAELFAEAGTSTQVEDGPGPTIVNEDEDCTVRQSLLYFSDVASLIQTQPNFRSSGEGITQTESSATSSSFLQRQNSRPLSLSSSILQYHTLPNSLDEVSPRSSFSDTSSDLTITPLRIQKKAWMPPGPGSASKDPFVDSSTGGNHTAGNLDNMSQFQVSEGVVETADHAASTAKSDQDNTTSFEYVSPKALSQDTNTNEDTPRHASHETCIPAPASQKVGAGGNQQKGARVTSEHRSSIPVAVRKVGTEHQNMPEGGSIGHEAAKTHATESTRRPHVSPFQHQIDTLWGFIPDEDIANEVSRYSSTSSSSSDWDGDQDDADELERPSGYTGDNLRPFERSAQRFYGPRLQIAASAENVIMGTPKLSSRSSPDLKRDVPRTATQSSPHNARLGEQGSRSVEGGQEAKVSPAGTPEASRNFCRPRPSLENNSRRDFSGRDLSIPRKPVGSPSLIDLHNPSLNDLPSQYVVPTVPKLPDGHNAFLRKDKPLPELKAARVKGAAAASGPHPTQTSSLQSVPASHGESAVTTPRTPNIPNPGGTTDLEHTVTFDHIVLENKHSAQRGKGKFPDSRSNRMLDGFRNIFKHKNAADKARIKNEESTDAAVEESAVQAQSGAADRACKDDGKVESATTASKSRIRSPRLPERAGWSKGARSISAPIHVSPGAFPTPTSSLSSIPAPSPRVYEEYQTPSFARPTKSTRTRAATNLRLQTPVAADSRFRRTSAMAASTGSPQRSTRVSRHLRSATGSKKTLQAKKIAEEHAATSESPGAASSQTTHTSNTDWLNLPQEQKDEEISAFIPRIFREICEEADRDKRAEMLRETLSLKHQLDTVNNARAVVTEAEETLRKKMEKKTVAERALYERFLQARTKVAS
ncbi:hypothetical protein KXW19_000715 [Aspergillus fumigatus]|nr:hypothetical protein KXX30_000836 [Aspergillus fumigatus]KAH1799216.1 hypothetical protein KXX36_009593 [Aspergillus fumigatus]KAH1832448.1 hypothetical protein KXX35_008676 [Aspergillus fumigatus]KAH2005441.1 hypothetical protein KXV80_000193 [Aspergillus fumigatus]KAH2210959.1 hypothetical protein KXW59_003764 [Aspergillus fumigatus]